MQASSSKKRSTIRIVNAKMLDKTGNFGRSVLVGTHLAKASEVRVSCCVKSARNNLAVLTIRSTKENQYVFCKRQIQRCQHSAHLRRSLARRRVHQMERRARRRDVADAALRLKRVRGHSLLRDYTRPSDLAPARIYAAVSE